MLIIYQNLSAEFNVASVSVDSITDDVQKWGFSSSWSTHYEKGLTRKGVARNIL